MRSKFGIEDVENFLDAWTGWLIDCVGLGPAFIVDFELHCSSLVRRFP
jgi:hypothetical protein